MHNDDTSMQVLERTKEIERLEGSGEADRTGCCVASDAQTTSKNQKASVLPCNYLLYRICLVVEHRFGLLK